LRVITLNQRILATVRRAFWLWLLFVPVALPAAASEKPSAKSPAEFDQLISQGFQYEQSGDWSRAVQLYESASKAHPNSQLLRERLRHCMVRYGLSRRYHDASFRAKMLAMPRGQALKLYDEVVRKIEESYVEPLDSAKLFRSGIDSLLIASEDDQFQKTNLRGGPTDHMSEFRDRVRQWRGVAVRDRSEAVRHVSSIASTAENVAGLSAAPVILEFVYGACDSLDDYSTCLTPDRLTDLYAVIDGNFVGIGVELRSDDDGLLVVNTLAGSPAAEAGIRGGDHIVAIEGRTTVGLPTDEAANRLQGAEGTHVQILIQSPGDSPARRVVLRRRSVEVQSVSTIQMLSSAEGIAYVQLTGFQKTSLNELERAVASLDRQGMRTLILDLRGNPGGLLTSAVDIADRFLTDGTIVSTRGRADGQTHTYRAQRTNTWAFPLVLLIDGESASASEILAGAIQDNHRGTIVGVRSFGKGSVQSIFPLDSIDAGVRLTTAKFYSPRGRAYSHQGVSPDIEVDRDATTRHGATGHSQVDPATDPQLAAALQASRQLIGRRASH
jgi:carboxyl-terminal processing protease